MVANMKVCGLTTFKTAKVEKLGKTLRLMKDNINKVKNMEKAYTCGLTEVFIVVHG